MSRRGWAGIVLVLAGAVYGCASAGRGGGPSDRDSAVSGIITRQEIASSGATSAWDLLRRRAQQYYYEEDQFGRAIRITSHRGPTTLFLGANDMPLVIIDGTRVTDLLALQLMPPDAISSIELGGGIGGTTTQGTNAGDGVIYIRTQHGSAPPR